MQATTPRVKQQHFPQRARLTGYLWRTSCGTTDILVCEVLHGCIGTCGDNCLGRLSGTCGDEYCHYHYYYCDHDQSRIEVFDN